MLVILGGIGMAARIRAQERAELSVGPLSGPQNGEVVIPIVLQRLNAVVGLQIDVEAVAGRLEVTGYEAGPAAAGLTLKSSVLTNGLTRIVLYSKTNTPLGEGEVIKVRGLRRNNAPALDRGLSIRAVTIADERGLLRQYAFSPFVEVRPRAGTPAPTPGQPLIIDVVSFPLDGSTANVEVSINGRRVASQTQNTFSVTWTPLEPGVAFITASATSQTSAGEAVPLTVTVQGTPLSTFTAWRSYFFPSDPSSADGPGSPLADPDRDQVPNLWEYAQGSDPVRAGGSQPNVESTVLNIGPDKFLALKVRMRAGSSDFEVSGESSPTLSFAAATTREAQVYSREKAGDFEIITLRDLEPVGTGPERFLRARIRPSPP